MSTLEIFRGNCRQNGRGKEVQFRAGFRDCSFSEVSRLLRSRALHDVHGLAMRLTTHLHLVPKLRTCGAIPSHHHTSSLRGFYLCIGTLRLLWNFSVF